METKDSRLPAPLPINFITLKEEDIGGQYARLLTQLRVSDD